MSTKERSLQGLVSSVLSGLVDRPVISTLLPADSVGAVCVHGAPATEPFTEHCS